MQRVVGTTRRNHRAMQRVVGTTRRNHHAMQRVVGTTRRNHYAMQRVVGAAWRDHHVVLRVPGAAGIRVGGRGGGRLQRARSGSDARDHVVRSLPWSLDPPSVASVWRNGPRCRACACACTGATAGAGRDVAHTQRQARVALARWYQDSCASTSSVAKSLPASRASSIARSTRCWNVPVESRSAISGSTFANRATFTAA